jgi:hypothetical protein
VGVRSGVIHADVDPEAYVLSVVVLVLATIGARGVSDAVLGTEDAHARQLIELQRLTKTALFSGVPRESKKNDSKKR